MALSKLKTRVFGEPVTGQSLRNSYLVHRWPTFKKNSCFQCPKKNKNSFMYILLLYVFDSFWHLKITQDLTVICLVEWDFFCNLICLVTMSAEKALCFSTRGFFGFLVESRDICPTRQIDSKVDVDGRNNLLQMHPGKMEGLLLFSSNQSTFEGAPAA